MARTSLPQGETKWSIVGTIVFIDAVATWTYFARNASFGTADWLVVAGVALLITVVGVAVLLGSRVADRAAIEEAQARQRVRQAEDKLSSELRGWDLISEQIAQLVNDEDIAELAKIPAETRRHGNGQQTGTAVTEEQLAIERRDDRLTLAALWDVTHGRMDLYHQIVTRQAKRSFVAAQVAMGIGFVLLVVFAVLAVQAKTTTAAISAGGLGAVGAAFAAYIGKTFIRSQESSASHLRAYFDQPLELSRYLAAERLLADATELTPEQHAAIVSSLVQSIATAGQQNGSATGNKPTGRQSKGRGLR